MELTHTFSRTARLIQDIVDAHIIGSGLAFAPAERAELASINADVRWIDVHVLDEMDTVAVLVLRDMGSHATERKQVVRTKELDAVFARESLVGNNFIFDMFDRHFLI